MSRVEYNEKTTTIEATIGERRKAIVDASGLQVGTWVCLQGDEIIVTAPVRDVLAGAILAHFRQLQTTPTDRLFLSCVGE